MSPIPQIHDVNIVIEDSCNCCCCFPRRKKKHSKETQESDNKTSSAAKQSFSLKKILFK